MKSRLKKYWFIIFPLILLIVISAYFGKNAFDSEQSAKNKVTFSDLKVKINQGKIKKIEEIPERQAVRVTEKNKNVDAYLVGVPTSEDNRSASLAQLLTLAEKNDVIISSKVVNNNEGNSLLATLLNLLPTIFIVAILLLFAYYYGIIGKRTKAEAAKTNVTFAQVAGCDEAIEELKEVRSFLSSPKSFEELGAKVPKGVLLHGAPGTGKTLIAKATAQEAGIPFYACSGSEFVEMFAGLGAKRVRTIFEQAKKHAPSILFIDELDAVGGKRSSGSGDGGTREADQTLIEILRQMDGFEVSENPVIVIGATNRLQALDSALTRPGRFDRHIAIDPPDRHGRLDVLRVHSKDKKIDTDVNLEKVAIQTAGMTGADLALLLNEAALLAARRKGKTINTKDIDNAYLRVVAGAEKRHQHLSAEERKRVAYHETGHALVRERLKGSDVVHKISIIPRGKSGGQTIYVSEEDVFLHSQSALQDMLAALLAGRAAEDIIFSEVSSGAADDLEKASQIGEQMLSSLGMGKTLGLRVHLPDKITLSDGERKALDNELKQLLAEQYSRALDILRAEENHLRHVAQVLLEEEVIDRNRFLELLDEVKDQ